jgi:hypothetical protein
MASATDMVSAMDGSSKGWHQQGMWCQQWMTAAGMTLTRGVAARGGVSKGLQQLRKWSQQQQGVAAASKEWLQNGWHQLRVGTSKAQGMQGME